MTNGLVIGLSALAGVWLGWYALPICLGILLILRTIERKYSPGIFLICLAFVLFGMARSTAPPIETSIQDLGLSTSGTGTIASFPIPAGDGHRALVNVSEICAGESCQPVDVRVLVYFRSQQSPLSRGQTVTADWRVQTLGELPPGYRSYVASQGAEGSARASQVRVITQGNPVFQWLAIANRHVSTTIRDLLPGDVGALATGIISGDDSALSDEAEAAFLATGTSHITAVSGQNVTLILGFCAMWFHPKTVRSRYLFHATLIVIVWCFTLFVGMEPPALRAAIVASLTLVGTHIGRRTDPVTILALTLGAMALTQPLAVHSLGFWLSAGASMALCLTMPREIKSINTRTVLRIAGAPAMASIATMPITLLGFGVWSPIGILANIVVAPLMTVAFPATYALALVATVLPGLAEQLAFLPAIPLDWTLATVNRMAPVAMQWRVDSLSPLVTLMLWTPILLLIWLMSTECDRWIRRMALQHNHLSTRK